MNEEPIYAGSLKAIVYEAKNGTFWTLIDEIWHMSIFEWIFPTLHYYFCRWAHMHELDEEE